MNIRNEISTRMEKLGVTQSALATATNIGQGEISQFLSGARRLSVERIERILHQLRSDSIKWRR
jgi:transcriptional regulator with XRE-family HTH domain